MDEPSDSSSRWAAVSAAVFLLTAIFVFHGRVLFTHGTTFPWDFRGYHLPLATAYADAVSERELPLWDPFTYCGRPLAANPQAAVYYPGMIAAVTLGRAGLLARLEWLAVVHLYLAGLLTYLLARRLGLAPAASLLAATVFMLGGFCASQVEHLGLVCATPWLALALAAVLESGRRRVLWLAFAWTMSLLAGFTAATVMTVLASAFFALLMLRNRMAGARDFVLAAALTVGMAAVQLGPTLELVGQSVGKYRTDWMGLGGGIKPEALITLFVPDFFHVFDLSRFRGGGDLTQMYLFCGWTAIVMTLWGMRSPRWRLVLFLMVCLVLMLGQNTPLGRQLFRTFPEFLQRATYWHVFLAPATLGLALLAGHGADRLGRWAWVAVLVAAVELTVAGAGRPMNTESIQTNPRITPVSVDGSTEVARKLAELAGDGRIDTANDSVELMAGAPILRWRAANGYDPLALERIIRVRLMAARGERWGAYYQIEQPDSPVLDWMSVKVVTSREPLATKRLAAAADVPGRHVYLNPTALPRYHADGCAVSVGREMRNRVELNTDCARASELQTSEAYYSAWRVSVDGQPTQMTVVHEAFRGVKLPAGRHILVFYYCRVLWGGCAAMSALGWVLWAFLMRRQA